MEKRIEILVGRGVVLTCILLSMYLYNKANATIVGYIRKKKAEKTMKELIKELSYTSGLTEEELQPVIILLKYGTGTIEEKSEQAVALLELLVEMKETQE